MDNKKQEREITTPDETDGVEIASMQQNMDRCLRSINYRCSIYNVPKFIRKENEEAYRPSVISIGPVYQKDAQLQTMQQLKWIFLESFIQHPKNKCRSLKHYMNMVREMEAEIRECYQQQEMLSSSCPEEFIEMILMDAVFLICWFMLHNEEFGVIRPIPKEVVVLSNFIQRDLFLLENQVPFFVLKRVFDLAFPTEPASALIDLTRKYIGGCNIPGSPYVAIADIGDVDASTIAHLLDFHWKCCCMSSSHEILIAEFKPHQLPLTAKQLSDAGVPFKVNKSKNPLNITFSQRNGEFHIPQLTIDDYTKAIFRSILFYEQCHYHVNQRTGSFIDLIVFLNSLISNVKDIQILLKCGILVHEIGSDEALLDLFKSICKHIIYSPYHFSYSSVAQEVNAYANKSWNQSMAILRRDYFSHPWAIISFIFAIIVFVLIVLGAFGTRAEDCNPLAIQDFEESSCNFSSYSLCHIHEDLLIEEREGL